MKEFDNPRKTPISENSYVAKKTSVKPAVPVQPMRASVASPKKQKASIDMLLNGVSPNKPKSR